MIIQPIRFNQYAIGRKQVLNVPLQVKPLYEAGCIPQFADQAGMGRIDPCFPESQVGPVLLQGIRFPVVGDQAVDKTLRYDRSLVLLAGSKAKKEEDGGYELFQG